MTELAISTAAVPEVPVPARYSLAGKAAVVTGASSGLGAAIARAFAQAGADVVLAARRLGRLREVAHDVETAGRRAVCVETDVAVRADCVAVVDTALGEFGKVDVLVNCAGVGSAAPATRETESAFRRVLDVNLMGAYWAAQACAQVMQPGSSIVNVGSVMAETSFGLPQAAYTSSKAGLVGLTRDLAQQWAHRKGIRVNLIAPGLFETEMLDEYEPGFAEAVVARRVPMRRVGNVTECAAVAVFLASPAASYVTGACVPVDGGLLTS